MRVRLKGINKVRKTLRDGTVVIHYYHRLTRFKLAGEPGSPEFVKSYYEAEKFIDDRLAGTLDGLIRDYSLSIEFTKNLAESTQKEYRRKLTKVEDVFGNMPLAALEDPRVKKDFLDWRSKVAHTSGEREADYRLSVLSAMLTWAVDNGRLVQNHLAGFKRLYSVDRSEMIWEDHHLKAFMAVAPVELQRALIIALHTGQRQGDILGLCWTNYDGQCIQLRQGKGKKKNKLAPLITIPCTPALKAMLDGMTRDASVILTTSTGLPWKKRYFGAVWASTAKKAGIEDLHFHDLRGTAVTRLAEAGCTVIEIAAITGHSLKTVHQILERYLARTPELASSAILKFQNAKGTKFANQMQTDAPAKKKGDRK